MKRATCLFLIVGFTILAGSFFLTLKVQAVACALSSDSLCIGKDVDEKCASISGNDFFCQATTVRGACICPVASICIPSSCSGAGEYEPDYACIISKAFNTPGSTGRLDCCENKCKDGTVITGNPGNISSEFRQFNIFNTRIRISYEKIPTLINLGFSTVTGILAIYAALRGIYIYAIKLPNTTKDEDIAAVSKEARAILTGFLLAVTFLLVTQVIFSILGLPALNEINLQVNPTETLDPEVPQIIIQ